MRLKLFFKGGRDRTFTCESFRMTGDTFIVYGENRRVMAEFYREAVEGYEVIYEASYGPN